MIFLTTRFHLCSALVPLLFNRSQACLIILAGVPAARQFDGKESKTREWAPMTVLLPILTGPTIVTPV